MAKIIPITEHFQHFLAEMKESIWGDLYGHPPSLATVFRIAVGAATGPGGRGMNAGGGSDETTAMAIMSGIS